MFKVRKRRILEGVASVYVGLILVLFWFGRSSLKDIVIGYCDCQKSKTRRDPVFYYGFWMEAMGLFIVELGVGIAVFVSQASAVGQSG